MIKKIQSLLLSPNREDRRIGMMLTVKYIQDYGTLALDLNRTRLMTEGAYRICNLPISFWVSMSYYTKEFCINCGANELVYSIKGTDHYNTMVSYREEANFIE